MSWVQARKKPKRKLLEFETKKLTWVQDQKRKKTSRGRDQKVVSSSRPKKFCLSRPKKRERLEFETKKSIKKMSWVQHQKKKQKGNFSSSRTKNWLEFKTKKEKKRRQEVETKKLSRGRDQKNCLEFKTKKQKKGYVSSSRPKEDRKKGKKLNSRLKMSRNFRRKNGFFYSI